MTDMIAPNQTNFYQLTGTQDKEIVINIQILSGNLKVDLNDFSKVRLHK